MLIVQDYTREYFNEVVAFAKRRHLLCQLIRELERRTKWAAGPGCYYDRTKGGETKTEVYHDFAPYSFRFITWGKEFPIDDWRVILSGGIIYEGPLDEEGTGVISDGSFPSLNVRIGDYAAGWHTHT